MRPNPAEEWQRLTQLYGEMSDGEVMELAASIGDLTEIAQPILRDEMKKRGLEEFRTRIQPSAGERLRAPSSAAGTMGGFEERMSVFGGWTQRLSESASPALSPENEPSEGDDTERTEYSWKVVLCECDTREQAKQILAVLSVAGIAAWSSGRSTSFGSPVIRVLVAADRLDEAKEVISRPIPEEVIAASKGDSNIWDFTSPTCPKCGAPDPILDSVDPVNTWSCEVCGATWSDPATADAPSSEPVS